MVHFCFPTKEFFSVLVIKAGENVTGDVLIFSFYHLNIMFNLKNSYNGTIFQNHSDSTLEHFPLHHGGLGNIRNRVITFGNAIENNTEVEIYDINNNTWAQKATFPLCS